MMLLEENNQFMLGINFQIDKFHLISHLEKENTDKFQVRQIFQLFKVLSSSFNELTLSCALFP